MVATQAQSRFDQLWMLSNVVFLCADETADYFPVEFRVFLYFNVFFVFFPMLFPLRFSIRARNMTLHLFVDLITIHKREKNGNRKKAATKRGKNAQKTSNDNNDDLDAHG